MKKFIIATSVFSSIFLNSIAAEDPNWDDYQRKNSKPVKQGWQRTENICHWLGGGMLGISVFLFVLSSIARSKK